MPTVVPKETPRGIPYAPQIARFIDYPGFESLSPPSLARSTQRVLISIIYARLGARVRGDGFKRAPDPSVCVRRPLMCVAGRTTRERMPYEPEAERTSGAASMALHQASLSLIQAASIARGWNTIAHAQFIPPRVIEDE